MTPAVEPVAMVEAEGAFLPAEEEGETGFRVRLLLGAAWSPAPWARVVGSVNAAGGEHDPLIWDAYVALHRGVGEVSVGFAQTPLFPSVQQPREGGPVPELSLTTAAFWPGRDAGIGGHLAGPALPLEAWVRVGNGSGGPGGNDNPALAGDARLDLVLGRARVEAKRDEAFGLRAGVGGHIEDAEDRPGLTGTLPTGFVFWRSPTISGPVRMGEAHAVALLGPVQWTTEAAVATEGRSRDTDGNPDTPREPLPAVASAGGSTELAWMVTGQHRLPGDWPVEGEALGVEVAVRGERLRLGTGARDVEPGGATGGEASVHVWHPVGVGASLTGGAYTYDAAPLEEPGVTSSWFAAARLTARWL